MRKLAIAAAAAATCLSLAAVACGSSGDKDDVEKTVNGVYDALAAKDAKKVCDSLSKQGRERIAKGSQGGKSCEAVFGLGLTFTGDALKGASTAKVTGVDVDGDEAVATVEYKNRKGDVKLVREGGEWKLNDLDTTG